MVTGRTTPQSGSGGTRRESMSTGSSGTGGNSTSVKVVVRIRPNTGSEASNVPSRFQRTVITPLNSTTLQVEQAGAAHAGATAASVANAAKNSGKTIFTFDRVIGPEEGQPAVYECAISLVDSFLEGMNSTILAYGQTSSGKSYTMGTDRTSDMDDDFGPERLGITPRAVAEIFDRMHEIQRETRGGTTFVAKLSYVEIYNEDLIDLLAGDADVRPMVQIREDKAGNIIWSGLREVKVSSAADVMNNLTAGSALRQTNATDMNAQSSRSHAIFSLTLTQRKYTGTGQPPAPPSPNQNRYSRPSGLPRVTSPTPGASRSATPTNDRPNSRFGLRPPSSVGRASPQPDEHSPAANGTDSWVTITSKFHFVDLAGSERLKRTSAQGERVKEGISINSGLHALGNVISALGDPARARQTTHIPYRDSKLTRLLQDSLGGNAQTMMVACVSPTEYNLNETISTVKYANRARNIKNRAEVNEVEVGWDDVEYLQKTITKLRGEMAAVKSGDGSVMGPIAEEGLRGGELAELQQKYAQVTADLAKAQQAAAPASSLSREDFARAVEPIVEEYEKSLSALESQLSLTKAALGHSEDEMRELEDQVEMQVKACEAATNQVGDLKSRIARLSEREATTEAYVRDLEAKLNDYGVQDEDHGTAVSDLRKEITRNREQAERTEAYIKDLEARLAKADDVSATFKRQIEVLERDIERREEAYHELESRLSLLDTSGEHKLLLTEIDERDRRLLDLERHIDELKSQNVTAEQESVRLQKLAAAEKEAKEELQSRVRTLERASVTIASPSKPRNGNMTPPQTPAEGATPRSDHLTHISSTTPVAFAALEAQIEELQHKYDQTMADLNSANGKYLESLKEIEDLNSQVQEAKLIHSEDGDTVPSPTSPSIAQTASDEADNDRSVSPSSAKGDSLTTPPAPARTPRSRRSMPLSPQHRLSFLGRGQGAQSGSSHLRSASLSQELSLAQALPTFSSPPSPRPHSPNRRESRDVFSATNDRTYEQMKGEVMKLQQALNEREEEIATLEASLHQLRSSSTSVTPNTSSPPRIITTGTFTPPLDSNAIMHPPTPDVSMSPRTRAAFESLRSEFHSDAVEGTGDEGSSIRLDNLMRSMAKKESSHRELIEDLEDQLSTLRRQHDELTVLSRDQVVNMSSEIDRLRTQLEGRPEASHYDARLATMQTDLDMKHTDLTTEHTRALESATAEHSTLLLRLKEEHADILRKTLAERDETLQQREAEHATLLRSQSTEHAEVLRLQDLDHNGALQAKTDEMEGAVKRKADELEEATRRFEIERVALADSKDGDVASAVEKLNKEHADVLEKRESEFTVSMAKLNADNSEALSTRDASHTATIAQLRQEHDEALSSTIAGHSEVLNRVRDEHSGAFAALEEKHAAASALATGDYENRTRELTDSHASALETLRQEHASAVETLVNGHKEELAALASQHTSGLDSAIAERSAQHSVALAELSATHDATLQTLGGEHSSAVTDLQAKHDVALQSAKEEHQAALAQQQEAHEAALSELHQSLEKSTAEIKSRDEEHTAAVTSLLEQHATALSALRSDHSSAIEALAATHTETVSTRDAEHTATLDNLRSTYRKEIEAIQTQHSELSKSLADLSSTHEALIVSHASLQTAVEGHATEKDSLSTQLRDLSTKHEDLTTTHQSELAAVQTSLAEAVALHHKDTADPKHEQTATELQEALDALSTLEKALLESQEERDGLLEQLRSNDGAPESAKELEHLRQSVASLDAELAETRKERDSLSSQVARFSTASPSLGGIVSNGFGGHEGMERAMSPPPHERAMSPTMDMSGRVTPPNARLGVNGSGLPNGKPPPPTPPPSMPPPPLPTALPALPNGRTARSSSASSTTGLSGMQSVRNSTSMDSTSSIRTPGTSVTDSVTIDPRVAKKFEEQEAQIARLTKQLTHCEGDLQANIDLVNTLESALNDSERNLRKARTQMNDLARERDTFLGQNDALRQQIQDAHSEVETVRHSVVEVESRLQREREQREQEAAMLRRLDDVDKRKKQQSKFNCF